MSPAASPRPRARDRISIGPSACPKGDWAPISTDPVRFGGRNRFGRRRRCGGRMAWFTVQAMPRTGRDALLEVLRTEGVRHLFGNPGSTELPLMDALAGADDLHYVLCLQEATAVGMADGYAQATGRPAFLNLHTSAGLGNAVGNLTNT